MSNWPSDSSQVTNLDLVVIGLTLCGFWFVLTVNYLLFEREKSRMEWEDRHKKTLCV